MAWRNVITSCTKPLWKYRFLQVLQKLCLSIKKTYLCHSDSQERSDDSLPEGGALCPSNFFIFTKSRWHIYPQDQKTRLRFLDELHVGFKLEETLFRWFHLSRLTILNMIDPIRIITDHIDAIAARFFEPIIHTLLEFIIRRFHFL